jgi:hypothetical protein
LACPGGRVEGRGNILHGRARQQRAFVLAGWQLSNVALDAALPAGVQLYTVTSFAWDPRKAAANARKHGIRFADAIPVLEDERAITMHDDADGEARCVTIGMDALAGY